MAKTCSACKHIITNGRCLCGYWDKDYKFEDNKTAHPTLRWAVDSVDK